MLKKQQLFYYARNVALQRCARPCNYTVGEITAVCSKVWKHANLVARQLGAPWGKMNPPGGFAPKYCNSCCGNPV
jgi:hypothetical protein